MTGNMEFGLTDYVILSAGVFLAFYSFEDALVRFGVILLGLVRGGTLLLSMASATVFDSVSALFVGLVVFFAQVFVSGDIRAGSIEGAIVIPGDAQDTGVFIGWACAGLEELIVITVMLYILIDSFRLSRGRTAIWLTVGIIGSFLINIVRMVVLVWVAFTWDTERMLWVHTHLGDFLFLVWIGIFWLLFFRLGNPDRPKGAQVAGGQAS